MSMKTLFALVGLVVLSAGMCYSWNSLAQISQTGNAASQAPSEAAQKVGKDSVVTLYSWNPGNPELWIHLYKSFSTNAGSSWGNQSVMFGSSANQAYADNFFPSLIGRGNVLHASWIRDSVSQTDKHQIDICYARSTNYGQTWSNPYTANPVTYWRGYFTSPSPEFPHLAATGHNSSSDTVMIVFRNQSSSPANEPYFVASTDAGINWSTPGPVNPSNPNLVDLTNVTYDQGRFIVVYSKQTSPTSIYSTYTTNGGSSWSTPITVPPSASTYPANYPIISANSGAVVCVWQDSSSGHLYSDTSVNGASHWGSNGQQVETSKPVSGSLVWPWPSMAFDRSLSGYLCAWSCKPSSTSQCDVYYSVYTGTWNTPANLTNAGTNVNYMSPRVSTYPNTILNGTDDFVTFAKESGTPSGLSIWGTERLNYPELFEGGPQSQGAIARAAGSVPMLRANPNPAGGPIRISCSLGEGCAKGVLKVYTVTGNLVKAFPVSGTNGLNWNLKDEQGKLVANGVYFLRLEGAGVPLSEKVVVTR